MTIADILSRDDDDDILRGTTSPTSSASSAPSATSTSLTGVPSGTDDRSMSHPTGTLVV